MYTHTFSVKLANGTKVDGLRFAIPSGADVFDPEVWRESDLFNSTDTDAEIAKAIRDHFAANATVACQNGGLRKSRNEAEAMRFVAGFRCTRRLNVIEFPQAVFDTFTEEQLAAMEAEGNLAVPKDEA
jgi:hypothetical protein